MELFDTYSLLYPLWLIFGGVIIGFMIYFIFFQKSQTNFSQTELLKSIYKKHTALYQLFIALIFLISLLFIVALSQPIISGTQEKVQKNGIDIEIVMDVSYSMIAEDIYPSRIEAAKKVFSDFVAKLDSDRVGLILFAGKPFQSVPLSYDYNFLEKFIDDLSVDILDQNNPSLQGTALGDALVLGNGVLSKQDNEREKVIILITDGEANKGIAPEIALKLLVENNIKTYTIGVGKDDETTINVVLPSGFVQQSRVGGLDEEILQIIAKETGGEYYRADSSETLEKIIRTIGELEKKEDEFIRYDFQKSLLYIVVSILIVLFVPLGYLIFIKKIQL